MPCVRRSPKACCWQFVRLCSPDVVLHHHAGARGARLHNEHRRVHARKDSVECLLRPAMLAHPIKKQRLVSKARAWLCSPGYARELVARIRLHVAKNATVFRQWPVFRFSKQARPGPNRFLAFIAPGYAGASDHDKSIWICTLRHCGFEPWFLCFAKQCVIHNVC